MNAGKSRIHVSKRLHLFTCILYTMPRFYESEVPLSRKICYTNAWNDWASLIIVPVPLKDMMTICSACPVLRASHIASWYTPQKLTSDRKPSQLQQKHRWKCKSSSASVNTRRYGSPEKEKRGFISILRIDTSSSCIFDDCEYVAGTLESGSSFSRPP